FLYMDDWVLSCRWVRSLDFGVRQEALHRKSSCMDDSDQSSDWVRSIDLGVGRPFDGFRPSDAWMIGTHRAFAFVSSILQSSAVFLRTHGLCVGAGGRSRWPSSGSIGAQQDDT